ncbi:Antiviral Innate Immune Response Receptor Rig-I [Manis pentadactyla]|nr:Antiviral Innate Immune Response Receptor Rig-I [Manis pentadactyla]
MADENPAKTACVKGWSGGKKESYSERSQNENQAVQLLSPSEQGASEQGCLFSTTVLRTVLLCSVKSDMLDYNGASLAEESWDRSKLEKFQEYKDFLKTASYEKQ